jgi:hypothetical protein
LQRSTEEGTDLLVELDAQSRDLALGDAAHAPFDVDFHEPLGHELHHLAQHIDVGALLAGHPSNTYTMYGRPRLAKRSCPDGSKEKIAAMYPDLRARHTGLICP